eukprot:Blabericola_migrator_1__4861@NODE_2546_length_2624_cov_9_243645_g1592_i0_p4_GENE_NODE_2546_length_2624_cov_9_243645_g1592_i0NODE_2546_length_2624_cov_9_243645_g1592_i0_p4_ORF_typecomplete_len154_score30_89YscJ_FliF_C/PF08345_11/0_22YscJ_FliF_C/PF08345_11/2_2e03SspB/PF04386_13/1_2SspB/PF04386_13/8_6e02_NODE_2546_length_2624_cov_9_243645_g1592_i012951756
MTSEATGACTLYQAPTSADATDTCEIDTTQITTDTPYIQVEDGAVQVTFPSDFNGTKHLVAAVTDTACEDLLKSTVTVDTTVSYTFTGAAYKPSDSTTEEAASETPASETPGDAPTDAPSEGSSDTATEPVPSGSLPAFMLSMSCLLAFFNTL